MQSKSTQGDRGKRAQSGCSDPVVEPAASGATRREKLAYLEAMIFELRELARAVPQSSLQSILDSALTETQIQLIHCTK